MVDEGEVEQLIEQKLDGQDIEELELDREALKQEIVEELEERDEEESESFLQNLKENCITRRDFLKALGLGAGGLALSSTATAGLLTFGTNQNTGPDAVNADTVDGKHASDLGGNAKDVKRNASGTVLFTQAGTDQVTGVTVTGSQTISVSTNTLVMYDNPVLDVPVGSGTATVKRNGATITSTGFGFSTKLSPTGSPRTTVTNWTGTVNWTGFPTISTRRTNKLTSSSDGSATVSDSYTFTGYSGTKISAYLHATDTNGSETIAVSVNNSRVGGNFTGSSGTFSTTTTGSFNSPVVTWVAERSGTFTQFVGMDTRSATMPNVNGNAYLTPSRNQTTTIS